MKKILFLAFIFFVGLLQAQQKSKSKTTIKKKVEKEWVNPVKLTKEERSRPYMEDVLKTRDSLTPKEAERRRKNIAIGNPFAKQGFYPKIATLSRGKYLEFHDRDSIVIIGSVKYNRKQKKIIGFIEEDLSNPDRQPIGDTHGRWISPDPLSEEFPDWTPYRYGFNNPLRFTDPTGMLEGDFINEDGKYLGNDGINDGKVYVVKTTKSSFDSGAPSAGISKSDRKATESFITKNSGNTSAFESNSIAYNNSVEIAGSADTRQAMVDIVNQDNGKGGTSDANNREYGGVIKKDGSVVQSPPGAVSNPLVNTEASINISSYSSQSTFHSHPSGTNSDAPQSTGVSASTTLGGSVTSAAFRNAPSNKGADITNSGSKVNYVFSRGNGTVYIYNNTGVIATVPQKNFVTPKK